MSNSLRRKVATATRNAGVAAVLSAAAAASMIGFAGPANAAPAPHSSQPGGMHGNPAAAAPYWSEQQGDYDCGEMAVADVVGQMTGHAPTEAEITATAGDIRSVGHSGPIYTPSGRTSNVDLPVLLAHYGIQSTSGSNNITALEQALDQGHKVIVGVNDHTLWNAKGNRTQENHFVVVTGIDTSAGVVHVNDSGIKAGRDEQVSLATFQQAWGTSGDWAVVTT
jgi:hypothetical protein